MTAVGFDMTGRGSSASPEALSFLSVTGVKWAGECPSCSEECAD